MADKAKVINGLGEELRAVIESAYRISYDLGDEIDRAIQEAGEDPLSEEDLSRLIKRVVTVLKRDAKRLGDETAIKSLDGDTDEIVQRILEGRMSVIKRASRPSEANHLHLTERDGIRPAPVFPRPYFHGLDIPMYSGFVKTSDIKLWDHNERLDIHLAQFRYKYGRGPTPEELLDIMLSKMQLPGVEGEDQFKIVGLARSIAVNGVRKPPILDTDGTLLDGNRRVTACLYVLNSPEFSAEQKRRAEYIFVWQLTEHTTDDQRDAVVVSLNFEQDHKEPWPEYVKARKVYEEWQAILAREPRAPGAQRQAQLKRELSKKFALGPETGVINRYLKMVDWAIEFEDYHTKQGKDQYEVKHRANDYFQYFDELGKGTKPGGVAHTLSQDEGFKHLAFDLLFQGKFSNWKQIRDLRHIYENDEARDLLKKAREETDLDEAAEIVDRACSLAHLKRAENRQVGANTRIEVFVKWLEELPVSAFRDTITPHNLQRLLNALELVSSYAKDSAKRKI